MEYKAKAKFVRCPPKKVARYLNMVRGANIDEALAKLDAMNNATTKAISKVIKAAAAGGKVSGRKRIKKIFVTAGPSLKRMRPEAFGRAHSYKRRMSHINVELEEAS
ncbi:MAG: 50S ribosomal protein L22 [Elusimicrobia bacterium CG08_land_8_20_14_0_20_44_26]|nr:MAG: 50S ribosomal protein L22 [Elusimicrobia bacterium CG08_land_8_20_14_0_20_44_26]